MDMEQKIDPKILAKIKKCLALAGSDNPNEAATALRQAHALMEKHGLGVHDVAMSDIGQAESPSQTMSRDAPADWEARLANQVAKAFGCKTLIKKRQMPSKGTPLNEGAFVFIGLKHQAEIAAYTASILIRKCRTGRQRWIARLSEQAKEQGGRDVAVGYHRAEQFTPQDVGFRAGGRVSPFDPVHEAHRDDCTRYA